MTLICKHSVKTKNAYCHFVYAEMPMDVIHYPAYLFSIILIAV